MDEVTSDIKLVRGLSPRHDSSPTPASSSMQTVLPTSIIPRPPVHQSFTESIAAVSTLSRRVLFDNDLANSICKQDLLGLVVGLKDPRHRKLQIAYLELTIDLTRHDVMRQRAVADSGVVAALIGLLLSVEDAFVLKESRLSDVEGVLQLTFDALTLLAPVSPSRLPAKKVITAIETFLYRSKSVDVLIRALNFLDLLVEVRGAKVIDRMVTFPLLFSLIIKHQAHQDLSVHLHARLCLQDAIGHYQQILRHTAASLHLSMFSCSIRFQVFLTDKLAISVAHSSCSIFMTTVTADGFLCWILDHLHPADKSRTQSLSPWSSGIDSSPSSSPATSPQDESPLSQVMRFRQTISSRRRSSRSVPVLSPQPLRRASSNNNTATEMKSATNEINEPSTADDDIEEKKEVIADDDNGQTKVEEKSENESLRSTHRQRQPTRISVLIQKFNSMATTNDKMPRTA